METKTVCREELERRFEGIKSLIYSASQCLKHGDFLQCAVRLQDLEKYGRFSELEMNVFEAESE